MCCLSRCGIRGAMGKSAVENSTGTSCTLSCNNQEKDSSSNNNNGSGSMKMQFPLRRHHREIPEKGNCRKMESANKGKSGKNAVTTAKRPRRNFYAQNRKVAATAKKKEKWNRKKEKPRRGICLQLGHMLWLRKKFTPPRRTPSKTTMGKKIKKITHTPS